MSLKSSLLGSITEVCIVTPDIYSTATGLTRLGIGPFQIFTFNSSTVTDRIYRNQPSDFELKVAFAKQGTLVFELMQPIRGASLMAEYLDSHGGKAGVQHVAFDMNDLPTMAERVQRMKERGFEVAMEGKWVGKKGECHFCFFDTLDATGTVFETILFSEDWEDPECELFLGKSEGVGSKLCL